MLGTKRVLDGMRLLKDNPIQERRRVVVIDMVLGSGEVLVAW